MNTSEQFQLLRTKLSKLHLLQGLASLAQWDEQVYMPNSAAQERGEQVALLAELRHEMAVDSELFDLLENLSAQDLSVPEKAIVTESLRDVKKERKKPARLVSELAKAESETHRLWLEARKEKNFSIVLKALERVVELKREYAQAVRPDLSTYDALLDDFERDARLETISARFVEIKKTVKELLSQYGTEEYPSPLRLPAKIDRQMAFLQKIAQEIGFDFNRGRLDKTVHPFASTAGFNDIRLTARFRDDDLFYGLTGFVHEMGHGLYEQGFNPEWRGTPLTDACSLVVHESQSLLFEKQLGFSLDFQSFLLSKLQEEFPNDTRKYTPQSLYRSFNAPKVSLIRLESGELSYALHIILRTELEAAIFAGDLNVADLPHAWAEKCQEAFGMKPANDLEGCLQDVHWFIGAWGYFPHYLGGAMYGAQLMSAFRAKCPAPLSDGNAIRGLLGWLRENIHSRGRQMLAEDMLETVTGSRLSEKAYLEWCKASLARIQK